MNLFKRFKLIKIEVPDSAEVSAEGRKSLATLGNHPGFRFLLAKLKLQRAALEAKLKYEPHDDLKTVIRLQEGIRWMMWLENQFMLAINHPTKEKSRDPNADELEALQRSLDAIEGVGD